MYRQRNILWLVLAAVLLNHAAIAGGKKEEVEAVEATRADSAVLWRNPQDIASRNLFFGCGGAQHQPAGDFTFVKEDRSGTNSKFILRDQSGVQWSAKMGIEAQPEVAASRLVWAVGYSTDEDYFVDRIHIIGLPAHLHRGRKFVEAGGFVRYARLKRERSIAEKGGRWRWRKNPFVGTREFNGLRVLAAVINDWDVKDINNAIRESEDDRGNRERVFLISDLGATFGTAGLANPRRKSKGNLASYSSSRFIRRTDQEYVDFETPKRASLIFLANPHEFFSRLSLRWVGRHISRADAHWTGELLARLSTDQIHDAFRAARYTPAEVDGFSRVLAGRIQMLNHL